MWSTIFGLIIAGTVGGIIYLYTRFQRFGIVRRIAGEKRPVRWLLALIPILLLAVYFLMDRMNAVVVVLHLMIFWLLGDLIGWIVNKIRKAGKRDKNSLRPYYVGIIVLVFTTIYLCIGWYLANHVWRTQYDLKTDKNLGQDCT